MSHKADTVIVAGRVHDFRSDDRVGRVLALRGGEVVASANELDEVQALIGTETKVVNDPSLTLLPGYFDTHNHLTMASADVYNVDISDCTSIREIVAALRTQASKTKAGDWVVASRSWHESTIAERRLPTARELDEVSTDHPVFVQRGGHVGTANSLALRLSGIDSMRVDPPGGTIVRDHDGAPLGPLIEFPAMAPIHAILGGGNPDSDNAAGFLAGVNTASLATTAAQFSARGLTAIRDTGIDEASFRVYQEVHAQGRLTVRARPMFMLDPAKSADENLEYLRSLSVRQHDGDDVLRVEGIKLLADGGVEGGWLSEPYTNQPDYCGHAMFAESELEAMVEAAAREGWTVGTHAVGDKTVRLVLDVYEKVINKIGKVRPGQFVIEHGFMADAESRARAVAAGIPITVQHPLLYALAGNMLTHWGPDRTAQVMPVAEWLEDGALIAGGSDCNVAPYDPLLAIWGFVTRDTKVGGIQGPRQAVDRRTAFSLYTEAGWRLTGEGDVRGRLMPGYSADIVAYREDPLAVDLDALPSLSTAFTVMGGRAVHDPDGYFN